MQPLSKRRIVAAADRHRAVGSIRQSIHSRAFGLLAFAAWLATVPQQVGLAAESTPWELRPYRVRVLVAADRSPVWTADRLTDLRRSLDRQVTRMIGKRWALNVGEAAAAWKLAADQATQPKAIAAELEASDKTIVVRLRSQDGTVDVTAREWDHAVKAWGPAITRRAAAASDLPATAIEAIVNAFSPVATIADVERQQVFIRGQAVGLPSRDAALSGFPVGAVLRLQRAVADTGTKQARELPWTYLIVEANNDEGTRCRVISRYGNAAEQLGRSPRSWLALRVNATGRSTKLRLTAADGKSPLANREVLALDKNQENVASIGKTDAAGRIEIPSSDDPLRVLVVRHAGDLVARLPLTTGWPRELQATIEAPVSIGEEDAWLSSSRFQLVELLLRRQVMLARVKSRAAADKQAAEKLLSQYRAAEQASVERLREAIAGHRAQSSSPDKSAWEQISKYLNDGFKAAPLDQLAVSLRPPPPKPPPKPAEPKLPGGWKVHASPTGGFQVAMPPSPKSQQFELNLEGGAVTATFTSVEVSGLIFVAMHYDLPVDGQRTAEMARSQARDGFARAYQAQFSEQSTVAIDGKQALQLSGTSANRSLKSRIVSVGARIYQVAVMGEAAKLGSAEVKFFLESLKINAQPAG